MSDITFSGNGQLPSTIDVLVAMLAQSPDCDKNLLLAYGYVGSPKEIKEAVSKWLNSAADRKLTLLVGLLPERKVEEYLSAIQGEKTYEPYLEERLDIAALLRNTKYLFEKIIREMRVIEAKRISVYGVTGYHGKACILLGQMSALPTSVESFSWDPKEALIGSSNLTENALVNNFELDVHLHRGSDSVREFSSAAKDYFWELFDRANHECPVSTTVTSSLQEWIDEAVDNEMRARRQRDAEAAERETQRESQRLLDADN